MHATMEGWSMDGEKERRRMNGRRRKGSALTSVPDAALAVRTKSTIPRLERKGEWYEQTTRSLIDL